MDNPSHLYHYTTLNNLALILKSQSLSFSRLDKVNDKREGSSSDYGSFASYMFITCWTETCEENLAFWNMYTPKMRGVRIELPLPIFEVYKIHENYESIIPNKKSIDKETGIFISPHKGDFYKIEYTDNDDLLIPKIIHDTNWEKGYMLGKLGKYKKKMWSMENEWRCSLNIFPVDTTADEKDVLFTFNDLVEDRIAPKISNYLIKINKSSFEQMKIRLGPKLEPGDYEIVSSLVNTYNNLATIELSSLLDDIR